MHVLEGARKRKTAVQLLILPLFLGQRPQLEALLRPDLVLRLLEMTVRMQTSRIGTRLLARMSINQLL
jgi:hypothetical protein